LIAPGERAPPTLESPTPSSPAGPHGGPRVAVPVPAAPAEPLAAVTGQQLLEEFIRYGRQRPFEEIVRRYAGMVFNVCFRVTKDKHDAEDAVQAVFLTLAVQAKRGADIKALGPWLQQVAKRLSLDVRRGKKRRKTREERHHDEQERRRSDQDPVPSADLDELKTILHEELQKLPAKYRLPLILHYFGGMTREEMAAELKTKPSTLGVRIFRGREMLAGRLNGRGIHLPAGAVAVAIGYLVKRSVTDGMVAATSHAAAALASGAANLSNVAHLMAAHDGAAAAARVVGLTRRAAHVLTVGKVRVTVSIALLTATSLGASVKALTLLPPLHMSDVRQLISAGVSRLVRPLLPPTDAPRLLSDAGPADPPATNVAVAPTHVPSPTGSAGSTWQATPAVANGSTVPPVVQPSNTAPAVAIARTDAQGAANGTSGATPTAPKPSGSPAVAAADGAAAAADGGHHAADPTAVRATAMPLVEASADNVAAGDLGGSLAGGSLMSASAADDLYVPTAGAATGASTYLLGGTGIGSTQIEQLPAVGGSVTESDGIVRGYGKIDRTGTLMVSGKVVADGYGVDRTLDLTSFTSVQVAASSAASTGWYAADHGRLSLPLLAAPAASTTAVAGPVATAKSTASSTAAVASTPTASAGSTADVMTASTPSSAGVTLTWGADPSAATLVPVNSVRLTIPLNADGSTPVLPSLLSLLSPDRSDAPPVPSVDGATIGLWQLDPAVAPLASVDITVRYDDHLVDELGGDEADVRLWTLGPLASDLWEPVVASTFTLDTTDHIVSGQGSDVDYFAVTVPPAAGVDAGYLTAHSASMVAMTSSSVASGVPEPSTGLIAGAAGAAGLLGRRRRRASRRGP
jgi:RNA polymerase sigma factor (sigma-70 family)